MRNGGSHGASDDEKEKLKPNRDNAGGKNGW